MITEPSQKTVRVETRRAQTTITPVTYGIEGTVVQRGASQYILPKGNARLFRRLAPGNEYTCTRLGNAYYSQKEVSYVVHVPAIAKKAHRKRGCRAFQVPQRLHGIGSQHQPI